MENNNGRDSNVAPPSYWTLVEKKKTVASASASASARSNSNSIQPPAIHIQNQLPHGAICQNSAVISPPSSPMPLPAPVFLPVENYMPLNQLENVLAHHQQFTFFSGKISCRARLMTVQIRVEDSSRPLLSILTTPNGGLCRLEKTDDNAIGATFKVFDACGKLLLSGKGNGQSIAVYCGDDILGLISEINLCSSTLTVRNVLGEICLQVVKAPESTSVCCGSSWAIFNIVNDKGQVLARMMKTKSRGVGIIDRNRSQIDLVFDSNWNSRLNSYSDLDVQTKTLILMAAHLTYVRQFAETPCGKMGYRGYFFSVILLTLILSVLLPLVIFRIFFV